LIETEWLKINILEQVLIEKGDSPFFGPGPGLKTLKHDLSARAAKRGRNMEQPGLADRQL